MAKLGISLGHLVEVLSRGREVIVGIMSLTMCAIFVTKGVTGLQWLRFFSQCFLQEK